METRRFGRTGHMSTVAIFGAAAFYQISQEEADKTMELVIESGINHIDVAPGYACGGAAPTETVRLHQKILLQSSFRSACRELSKALAQPSVRAAT